MSEYQDTQKMLDELKALGSLNEKRQYLAKLNARQLQLINWRMPNEVSTMRDLQKAVKKAYIERRIKFETIDEWLPKAKTLKSTVGTYYKRG